MKIAFVANTCWNIYNFRKGLVHHFLSRGDQIVVFAPRDEYSETIESWEVRWIETPLNGIGNNPIRDLRYFINLYSAFATEKPDVALSFTIKPNIYSCIVGKLTGVPVICNVSGLGTIFLTKGFVRKLALLFYSFTFSYAQFVFFQNEDDRTLFISVIKIPDDKIGTLPGSGINLQEFDFSIVQPLAPVKFLMIARLIFEKGVREYSEAAAHFLHDERVSFTLIGKLDEDHPRSIEKWMLDQWISDGWIRYYPHSDHIKDVIRQHEVVVLPSYREGTSRALLEGAAMGKVLLASDVPGCRTVVEDGFNGFLFHRKDPQSMVDKIKLYLSLNKDEKLRLSANSRTVVKERFDEKIVFEKYVNILQQIVV